MNGWMVLGCMDGPGCYGWTWVDVGGPTMDRPCHQGALVGGWVGGCYWSQLGGWVNGWIGRPCGWVQGHDQEVTLSWRQIETMTWTTAGWPASCMVKRCKVDEWMRWMVASRQTATTTNVVVEPLST